MKYNKSMYIFWNAFDGLHIDSKSVSTIVDYNMMVSSKSKLQKRTFIVHFVTEREENIVKNRTLYFVSEIFKIFT